MSGFWPCVDPGRRNSWRQTSRRQCHPANMGCARRIGLRWCRNPTVRRRGRWRFRCFINTRWRRSRSAGFRTRRTGCRTAGNNGPGRRDTHRRRLPDVRLCHSGRNGIACGHDHSAARRQRVWCGSCHCLTWRWCWCLSPRRYPARWHNASASCRREIVPCRRN